MWIAKCILGCKGFEHAYCPRTDELREKWRQALGLDKYKRSYKVCDRHFDKSAFLAFQKRRLLKDAVPSLNLTRYVEPPPPIVPKEKPVAVLKKKPPPPTVVPYLNLGSGDQPPTIGFKTISTTPTYNNGQILNKRGTYTVTEPALTDLEADELCNYVDPQTNGFFLQQTMYRIKDPRKSLPFYSRVLGMVLLEKLDFPDAKFSLYLLGFEDQTAVPHDSKRRTLWAMSRPATLQLTHNWGTENDPNQKYHNGNYEPRGYGHIAIMVPDVYAACERFEQQGVEFMKKPDEGRVKGLAFIKDPDGYWIQIFNAKVVCQFAALK